MLRLSAALQDFDLKRDTIFLLKAFSMLDQKPYLVLAGTGPLQTASKELCRRLMINDRVKFLGDVADVRPLLAASDLTVLASTAVETFSIAMLESMAMKVPTFVTDIGGLSEAVIPGETGELVEPGNSAHLSEKLGQYIDNKQLLNAMGEKARLRILDHFCNDKMIKSTESLLNLVYCEGRKNACESTRS